MADAASLRLRVHGPATGGIIAAPPKTWDESKVKGYNPNWDESKVKRDTDPGEEGQFDFKDGRSRGTSKTEANRRAREAHANKMKAQKKAWDEKVKNAKTVGARQVLMGNAMEKGWEVTQRKDGSVLIKTPNGTLELPPDDVYMQYPESRDAFIDYAISQNMTVERFEDGSGWIITPWGNRVEFPSNQFYKDRDAMPKPKTAALTATATKDWKPDKRREAAERGWALPDGSYPIKDERDWYKARQALGRAKNRELVIKHLRRRAKALGIPDSELDGITAATALTAAYPAALGKWNPDLHPRGKDGKFIEKFGFVRGLFEWDIDSKDRKPRAVMAQRAKVVGFAANKEDPDDPFVVVENSLGNRGYGLSSTTTQVAAPKGDLSDEDKVALAKVDKAEKFREREAEFQARTKAEQEELARLTEQGIAPGMTNSGLKAEDFDYDQAVKYEGDPGWKVMDLGDEGSSDLLIHKDGKQQWVDTNKVVPDYDTSYPEQQPLDAPKGDLSDDDSKAALLKERDELRRSMPGYETFSPSREKAMDRLREVNAELKALEGDDTSDPLDAEADRIRAIEDADERWEAIRDFSLNLDRAGEERYRDLMDEFDNIENRISDEIDAEIDAEVADDLDAIGDESHVDMLRDAGKGARVMVPIMDGTNDFAPTGEWDRGTIRKISPEGAVEIQFDDGTIATVAGKDVELEDADFFDAEPVYPTEGRWSADAQSERLSRSARMLLADEEEGLPIDNAELESTHANIRALLRTAKFPEPKRKALEGLLERLDETFYSDDDDDDDASESLRETLRNRVHGGR